MNTTARQIVLGDRLRWAVELFHKDITQRLGFEDVATRGCASVTSHVPWGSCADILLPMAPPGVPPEVKSLGDTQRKVQQCLAHKEKRRLRQPLTHIGGVQRYKDALRQALADT